MTANAAIFPQPLGLPEGVTIDAHGIRSDEREIPTHFPSRCANCGYIMQGPEDLGTQTARHTYGGGRLYVRHCNDCVFTCTHCDHVFALEDERRTTDDASICENCANEDFVYSERRDGYIYAGDAIRFIDADGDEDYVPEHDATIERCRYCERCNQYEHADYRCPREPRAIRGYHSGVRPVCVISDWPVRHGRSRPTSQVFTHRPIEAGRYFGVELEVEVVRDDCTPEGIAQRLLDAEESTLRRAIAPRDSRPLFHNEHDGSLQNGFELITRPMGLDAHRTLWPLLLSAANIRGLHSHRSGRCGLHVHVTRASLTKLQTTKMARFVNDPENETLIRAIARRYNTHYCELKRHPKLSAYSYGGDRYEALNLCNSATVEFRIFRGTLKPLAVIAAIEFCHAVAEFCADTSPVGMMLTRTRFLDYLHADNMRAETHYLRAYLSHRGVAGITTHSPRSTWRVA